MKLQINPAIVGFKLDGKLSTTVLIPTANNTNPHIVDNIKEHSQPHQVNVTKPMPNKRNAIGDTIQIILNAMPIKKLIGPFSM